MDSSRKRTLQRSTLNIESLQIRDQKESRSKKSRLPSSSHDALICSLLTFSESSETPSLLLPSPPLRFKPVQLEDDNISWEGFLKHSFDLYRTRYFSKNLKLSKWFVGDTEFSQTFLMKLQQNDPSLLSLDLEYLNTEAATHLSKVLTVNSSLLELSIQYTRLSKVIVTQLVEALKLNSTLTRLSLRNTPIDDAAATQLNQLLRYNTTLLSLDLSRTGLTGNGIIQLSEAFCVNHMLTHLDLPSNLITTSGLTRLCEVLTVNSILTTLDLRACNLRESGILQLSCALEDNPSLIRLEIGDDSSIISTAKESLLPRLFSNRLHRIHLPRLFQNNSTLTWLKLYHHRINDADMTHLSEALTVNSTLKGLILWGVTIDDLGMTRLNRALAVNTSLTILELNSIQLNDAEVAKLGKAVMVNSSLSSLWVPGNNITEFAPRLSAALKINSTLEMINLDSNQIGDAGATHLSDVLKINSTLKEMRLAGNRIGDPGLTSLSEAIRVNTSLKELRISLNQTNQLGATRLSEALMVNSTLFRLDTKVPDFLPPVIRAILLEKPTVNRFEKNCISKIINNDPTLTDLNISAEYVNWLDRNSQHFIKPTICSLGKALMLNTTITTLFPNPILEILWWHSFAML